jgi:hypothetical protein
MKHYAGIDLSMETSHVCVVDAEGRKVGASCVESTPEAIAAVLNRHGPVDRAVIETARMTPFVALGLRDLRRHRLYRRTPGSPEPKGDEGQQDRSA